MAKIRNLAGLAAYLVRPEGDIEPVKTNWTVVPSNDNAAPEEVSTLRVNRRWATRPTIGEIEQAIEVGETEYGIHTDADGNPHRVIVAIGSLQFSDGTKTEKAYAHGPDGKLIMFDALLPVGAMLNTKDAQERMLGGDAMQSSNASYTAVYKAQHPGKAKRKARDTEAMARPQQSKAEMQAELDAAMAGAPKVTMCKAGFPWKPSSLRELFCGFEKSPKGESGSIAWQDISGHIVEREIWLNTLAAVSDDDKGTLDAAGVARTLKDLVPGKKGGNAYRVAKARLMAANDNLLAAAKKYSGE